jgi:hypothetical protein
MKKFKRFLESKDKFEDLRGLQEELKTNKFWPMHDILAVGEGGEEYWQVDDIILQVKLIDKNLAKDIKELTNIMQEQSFKYNEDEFDVPFRELAEKHNFDWYDQYNCRLTCMPPSSYDSDMNGADWRSVTSISKFLKKTDKKLFKIFDDVWDKNFISQEDVYDIAQRISDLDLEGK